MKSQQPNAEASPHIQVLDNPSITDIEGLSASGVACGIKETGAKDVALVKSDFPMSASAVFTTNQFQAAPVLFGKEILQRPDPTLRALLVNSGNANACTGEIGLRDTMRSAEVVASSLKCQPEEVFVMSTGVIGVTLPMPTLEQGIEEAVKSLTYDGGKDAALAIMTTDTMPKEAGVVVDLPSLGECKIIGMSKGSGMIHPNMATMLAAVFVDASISSELLNELVRSATEASFNRISVDGDTSTNDTYLLCATNRPGAPSITAEDTEALALLREGIHQVSIELAKMIVMDGEGATKFIHIKVDGAETTDDATLIAKTIGRSNLVKTAMFGEDPNWGRIVCAAGYSGVIFDTDGVDLSLLDEDGGSLQLVAQGQPLAFVEEEAERFLKGRTISILLSLSEGNASSEAWTSDLSHRYVEINAEYRT